MTIPMQQKLAVGSYVLGRTLRGRERFPLVLMLEPLFRCNLSCAGCSKITQPEEVLRKRLSVEECVSAAEECGAPVVSIPGGEPLLHPEIGGIVKELISRKRFVYLCTNGLLLKDRLGDFTPSQYLSLSVHLDGFAPVHDSIVGLPGAFDRAVEGIKAARDLGFRVTTNTTLFSGADPEEAARFFDFLKGLGVEAMMVAPGFPGSDGGGGEKAGFLSREDTTRLFSEVFRLGRDRAWPLSHSPLYLDFLAGRRELICTPWGNPTRNIFGWQKPCYLLNDGYAGSWRELMEETDWNRYGRGRDPRCEDCMVHCGYEPTAVTETIKDPISAVKSGFADESLVSGVIRRLVRR